MKARWIWAVAAAATVGLGACGDDDDDGGGAAAPPPEAPGAPQACTPPATATVTFSASVHRTLQGKCTPCHSTTWASADRATAYAAARAQVDVANPAQSALIRKGDAQVAHGGGDQLDPVEVTSITTWVRECAQNN